MATGVEGTFTALAVLLVSAVGVVAVARLLRQPLMIGYILTGVFIAVTLPAVIGSTQSIETFAQIGVIFLLFMVGLNLDPDMINDMGKVSVLAGIGQVVLTGFLGFGLVQLLGFNLVEAVYLAVAATFSSTIVIMKLLSDMDDLEALHGRILTGLLIVQDLIVISALLVLASLDGGTGGMSILLSALQGGAVLFTVALLTLYVLPQVTKLVAAEQEFLLLFSVGWCFALASAFHVLNFSLEAGALLAGIALSTSPYRVEIAARMKPLRDFFLMIFFVFLGLQLTPGTVVAQLVPALILSGFILVVKPGVVMAVIGWLGYQRRTTFLVGASSAQISEFSLVLLGVGVSLGHISQSLQSLMTLVGLITITVSSYLILYGDDIYPYLSRFLAVFERADTRDETVEKRGGRYDVILFGHNRIGHSLAEALHGLEEEFLVVDHDPEVIDALQGETLDCMYGDAGDLELLEQLHLETVDMVISTVPDKQTNLLLVNAVRKDNPDAVVITVSHRVDEALALYEAGASYVVMPHFLGGDHAALLLQRHGTDRDAFEELQEKHIEELEERKALGHEHPQHENTE